MSFLALLVCTLLLVALTSAIPVDNGVEGEPEIECGADSIAVEFNTRNNFEGHVYVKGLYNQSECRNDEGGRMAAGITLPFDSCNVQRTRTLNPPGIEVTANIVVSFHPQFVTKVDRAYRIRCFYMEADKTVSQDIAVSELTTSFETVNVPMPICRYDILEGGPNGTPIQYALVGQQVYHKWTCETETTDTFCMVVHSCTIDDGSGDTVHIIDENGCALDRFLLNNLEYPGDMTAGQEAHVYKYADRDGLFYECQISISIKEPHGECGRPECAEPQGFGALSANSAGAPLSGAPPATGAQGSTGVRQKRQAGPGESVLDVRAELNAFNFGDQTDAVLENLKKLLHRGSASDVPAPAVHMHSAPVVSSSPVEGICVAPLYFSVLLACAFACSVFILVLLVFNARSAYSAKRKLVVQ